MQLGLILGLGLGGIGGLLPTFSLDADTGFILANDNGFEGPANLTLTSATYPTWDGTYPLVWPITTPQVLVNPVIAGATGASNPPVPGDTIEMTVPALILADSASYQWMVDGVASGSPIDAASISVGSLPQFTAVAGDIRLDVTATIGAETVTVSSNTITVAAADLLTSRGSLELASFTATGSVQTLGNIDIGPASANKRVLLIAVTNSTNTTHVPSACTIDGVSAPYAQGALFSPGTRLAAHSFLAQVSTAGDVEVQMNLGNAGTVNVALFAFTADKAVEVASQNPTGFPFGYTTGENNFDQNVLAGEAAILFGTAQFEGASLTLSGTPTDFTLFSGDKETRCGVQNITADESPRALRVTFAGDNRRCGGSLVIREVV